MCQLGKKKKSPEKQTTIENLGDFIQFGYYSVFIIILYEMLLLPQMSNMTFMIYGGYAPKVIACGNYSLQHFTKHSDACSEMSILQNTTGCTPEFETQFGSVAYEFGYYCNRVVEVKKSISVQMFGVLCGSLIFGQFSDWFGRKRIMLITHLGMFVLDYAATYAQTLDQFTTIMFATMFFVGGHNTIMHVFLLENMPKRHRVWVFTALSYSPNYIIFAGVAYLAGEWRTLLSVISLLNVPAFFGLLWAFESPRWMIQRAKLDSARTVLMKIERINGTATDDRLRILDEIIEKEVQLNENKKRRRKYYFYHLFYTRKMCFYALIISFAILCTSVISYALIFNMEHLSGSIFLNSAFFGLFRYSMNLMVGSLDYFVPKVGRKTVHQGALSFIVIALGIVFASKLFQWDDANLLRITTLGAAAMCSQLYMVYAVVTSELFPTAVRNLAASFVQVSSRTGAIIAPHLFYLAIYWQPLPFLVMLLPMLMNMAFFSTFIPETKNWYTLRL
ncbi:sugar transporter domain-containing protein [Ditylenchus destructor]|uniref:Sugar transporter domain-containing protein n=1 Tax=Ditylenchus destructor TaxID=166010 RepID=A0AAD4NFG4_9BILA|nr:sugar transporter domain-containing protein [Ditylenchus destructor]